MNKTSQLLASIIWLMLSCNLLSARALKILVYVNHFPHPSQTFVINQVAGLVEQGHDVSILTTSAKQELSLPKSIQATFNKLLGQYNLKNKIFRVERKRF